MPNSADGAQEGDAFAEIARIGMMGFGFYITLAGLFLLLSVFYGVYGLVFKDAGGLKEIFEQWREIIIPAGMDPAQYDANFPLTTVLVMAAMAVPVLFLTWLATKVLTIGVRMARYEGKQRRSAADN